MAIKVPIPVFSIQQKFVDLTNALKSLTAVRMTQQPVANATLPSLVQKLMA
jgi:hypothetical protein